MPDKTATVQARLIETARQYLGMRSRAYKVNEFAARAGYDGKPWAGSFLETVHREISVSPGTVLTSSTAALAYFMRTNRVFQQPRVGDLVYFAFSTDDDGFGPPHVGLVTEVRDWKKLGVFRTVEAQVSDPNPKSNRDENGVFERTRFATDVLAFVRPVYVNREPSKVQAPTGTPTVTVPAVQPGKPANKGTVHVQEALNSVIPVRGLTPGVVDSATVSLVRAYQRRLGYVPAPGTVDARTLSKLASETNYKFFVDRP